MRCAIHGCRGEGRRQCAECSRQFCDKHIETCSFCNAEVCFECREAHLANSPLHEEGPRGE